MVRRPALHQRTHRTIIPATRRHLPGQYNALTDWRPMLYVSCSAGIKVTWAHPGEWRDQGTVEVAVPLHLRYDRSAAPLAEQVARYLCDETAHISSAVEDRDANSARLLQVDVRSFHRQDVAQQHRTC
jgi:hypothetical protein